MSGNAQAVVAVDHDAVELLLSAVAIDRSGVGLKSMCALLEIEQGVFLSALQSALESNSEAIFSLKTHESPVECKFQLGEYTFQLMVSPRRVEDFIKSDEPGECWQAWTFRVMIQAYQR